MFSLILPAPVMSYTSLLALDFADRIDCASRFSGATPIERRRLMAKGGKGGGKAGSNPNWPSKTGNPSGGGRGNNPPKK